MQVPTLVPSWRAEVMTAPMRPGGASAADAVVRVAAVLADTAATPKTTVAAHAAAGPVERVAPTDLDGRA